jgi:hypothetical protein
MRSAAFAAVLAYLLLVTPAFTDDSDDDGVEDGFDNCLLAMNPAQDDTDGDGCGNVCDADYNNDGLSGGHADFGAFINAFGTMDEEKVHRDPVAGKTVGHRDWGFYLVAQGLAPGPSGTTPGTTACP